MKQKATLIIDGKEITVEIDKKELEKLEEKPFPQEGDKYWLVDIVKRKIDEVKND